MKKKSKNNDNYKDTVRNKGSVINKTFVNQDRSSENREQISESQKRLVKNNSDNGIIVNNKPNTDSSQIISDRWDNRNIVTDPQRDYGEERTENERRCENSEPEPQREQEERREYNQTDTQSPNPTSEDRYTSSYRNYANRVRYENVQYEADEPTEQTESSDSVMVYGSESIFFGHDDNSQPRREETAVYESEPRRSESPHEYYTRPYVSSSKQGYEEQVRNSRDEASESVYKSDYTQAVVNNANNIPIAQPTESVVNVRDKSDNVVIGTDEKLYSESNTSQYTAQERNVNQGIRQPEPAPRPYQSSVKQGISEQVKGSREETSGGMVKDNNYQSVVNRADNIPIAQLAESVVNVRDKSDNIIIGTSEKPFSESNISQYTAQERSINKGTKQPEVALRPYQFSVKQGISEQVKSSRKETTGGMVKDNGYQSVANRADNIPIVQPTESVVNVYDKSDNIIIGTSEKPYSESNISQYTAQERNVNQGIRQPEPAPRPYQSSVKQGISEQVRNRREETAGGMVRDSNYQSVVNRADSIPTTQSAESVVNVRDKSDNIIIGTSEKPSLESGAKPFENGEKQPDTSSRPYRSSSKRGLAEQVKNSREETVGDVDKSGSSQAVINNADNTAVIQPAENIVNVREQTAADGIIKGSDYGQTKEENPIFDKVPINLQKNARTVVGGNKNTENKAKKSSQDIYTTENSEKTIIKGIDSENIIETDVSNEAFTYRDKAKAADVVRYRDGDVKNDIARFKADDSIIEADYKGSVTDNSKALVRDKDRNNTSESGGQSDFSKYVHKKNVNKIQKSVGDSENKTKTENIIPEKNYSENVVEKDVSSEVFTYRDKAKAVDVVKLRDGEVKTDTARFKSDEVVVDADYKSFVTDTSKALVGDKNNAAKNISQTDCSEFAHKNAVNKLKESISVKETENKAVKGDFENKYSDSIKVAGELNEAFTYRDKGTAETVVNHKDNKVKADIVNDKNNTAEVDVQSDFSAVSHKKALKEIRSSPDKSEIKKADKSAENKYSESIRKSGILNEEVIYRDKRTSKTVIDSKDGKAKDDIVKDKKSISDIDGQSDLSAVSHKKALNEIRSSHDKPAGKTAENKNFESINKSDVSDKFFSFNKNAVVKGKGEQKFVFEKKLKPDVITSDIKAEKTKSLVREKTVISDVVIKDKSVYKADGIKTAKDGKSQKDNNKAKTKTAKQGIAGFGAEAVKSAAVSEINSSDDEGLQLVGKAAVAGRILADGYSPLVTSEMSKSVKIPSKTVSKTTKGTFRRSKTDKAGDSPLKKAFAASVIPTGKELMNGTAARAGTIGKNTLKEGKYALKNTVVKAVSENADNSLAIAGVDMGIKAADTVTTAVRGTKAAVNTGKGAVKTAASAPKNVYNGAKKLKELSNRLYKFARMKRTQKIQAVGRGIANIGKITLTAAVNMISAVVSAVAGFFMPLLLIALIIFAVIATIISLIPIISLKADDAYLTEVWEYISEKDADLEIKYKDTYYNYPSNYQHFGNIIVNKYFSVNGSEIISEEDQRYTFRRYVNVFDFTDEEFRPVSSDTRIYNTSYKSNIDAFLAYLDAKYEDYEFSEVKSEIDNLYEQIVRVQYVDNEDEPSWKMIHEIQYRVFNMNVNLHYTDTNTYIQNNYDTFFTDKEKETYEVLDDVGQYLTRIELGCPIETTDDSIACQKRYGYYVESDADAKTAVKKFYKGIDITAEPGTNVLSPLGGQISSINGDEIEIYSSSGKKYITLSNVTGITVSEGDTVRKGDVLGQANSSGYICITYRIKKLGTDTYLNLAFYIDNVVYVNNANTAVMYDTSAIDLSQYTISTELTGTAAAVVRAALAMVGASGYSGMCATVASKIYQEAGLGYHGGNGNEFSRANKLSVSSGHVDYTKIPVGAYIGVKYGTGSAGYTYGHVGIYVGLINGEPTVVEGGGTLVRTTSLDHFYSYYVTNNSNSYYGNDIGWNITSTGGSVSPLYFEGTESGDGS